MSLIEEALRKQELEAAGPTPSAPRPAATTGAVTAPQPDRALPAPGTPAVNMPPRPQPAAATPPPPTPPPAPLAHTAIHPDVARQRSLTYLIFGGIGALMALLLISVAFFVIHPHPAPLVPDTRAPEPPAPASTLPAAAVESPAKATAGTTTTPANAAAKAAPLAGVATTAPPVAPTARIPTVTATTTQVPATTLSMPPSPTTEATTVPVIAEPALIWPEIVIKGMFSSGGKTLVLLGDGRTLEAGATTPGGIRLLSTGPGWVRLTYKGETRTYRRNGGSFTVDPDDPSPEKVHP